MSETHYSIGLVKNLQSQFTALVREVVIDASIANKSGEFENTKKTYKLIIDKETGEYVPFEFIFRKNPLFDLLKNRDGEVLDEIVKARNGVATATTFIQGRPWAITFEQEDLDKTVEQASTDEGVLMVAQGLLEQVVAGMAQGWYYHGLRDRICVWNHESNFSAIKDQFDGMIDVMWDDVGYLVDVLVPDHSVPPTLHVIKRDLSFIKIPHYANPLNKNVDICQRYLDSGIVSLIALGYAEKGFSWKMN